MAFVFRFKFESGEVYHRAFGDLGKGMEHLNNARGAYEGRRDVKALQEGVTGLLTDYAIFQTREENARRAVQQVKDGATRLIADRDSDMTRLPPLPSVSG